MREVTLKEKKYGGALGIFILGLMFLVITGFLGWMLFIEQSESNLLKTEKYYTSQEKHSPGVLRVNGIADLEVKTTNNTAFYLVLDQEDFILLEAKQGDKVIEEIFARGDQLVDNPYPIKVIQQMASNYEDFTQLATSVNENYSLNPGVSMFYYASLSEAQSSELTGKFVMAGMAVLSIGMIGIGIVRIRKNQRNYDDLYTLYPELRDNLDKVQEGKYFNQQLGVAIYKQHLVIFAKGFDLIEINEIDQIYTTIQHSHYSFFKVKTVPFITVKYKNGKIKNYIVRRIGNSTDIELNNVYAVVNEDMNS